jgi:glycosyltransferase involved in cell wall biosynthesis
MIEAAESSLVSVVVSAYNNWPDLEMAIESALQQSYQPIEVIVVDNSSTDETMTEVPQRFGNRVRYVRQPNRECAGAHNAGFALASGKYIQFLAGDDVLAPNKIQKQVDVFRENPDIDIVYGDIRKFQAEPDLTDWIEMSTKPEKDMLMRFVTPANEWNTINTLGVLFHRRALERIGPWDESLYIEDTDYWLRCAWAGCEFGYCAGSPMGFRRMRPGQKIKDLKAMARGREAVWDKALGYITTEPYRSKIMSTLAVVRFRMALEIDDLTTAEALDKLALARATDGTAISRLLYLIGCATVVVPGGKALARSRWPWRIGRVLIPRRLRRGEND